MNTKTILAIMAVTAVALIPISAYAETFTYKDNLENPFAARLIPTEAGYNLVWHVPSSVDDYRLVKVLSLDASVESINIWKTDGFLVDVTDHIRDSTFYIPGEGLVSGKCVMIKEFFNSGIADAIRLVCI